MSAVEKLQAKLALAGLSDAEREIVSLSAAPADDESSDPNVVGLKGKLDWSPKSNWVEDNGGLPKFIEDMAVHMMENSGLERSHAIAASVQRTKVLAGKGNRRATEALAQWEALKGKAKAKKAAKDG